MSGPSALAEPGSSPSPGRHDSRRSRWWLVGLTCSLLVGVGLVTWSLGSAGDQPSTVEVAVPTSEPQVVEPAGAALALQGLERAVTTNDADLAAAVAAPTTGADALVRSLVANADEADIVDVSFRYVDELGPIGPDGAWPAAVAVEWRYDGFDLAPARTETVVRFSTADDGVRIAGIGGDSLRTPVWLTGPLAVSRSRSTLVLSADAERLDDYVRLAQRAVPVVSKVLTAWVPQLVLEIPRDADALERALDVDPGTYRQIAAVTGSADGSVGSDAPVHVYVNPEVFGTLGRSGQEVVLDHEVAHVAGDGPISRAPTWLVEGFADYVALRDSTLPLTTTAAQIRDQVRAEGPPTALPSASAFDTLGPHLGAVYESAWLACQALADRGGDAAFLRFYDEVSDGAPVRQTLRRVFGWSEQDLLDAWQDRLTTLP